MRHTSLIYLILARVISSSGLLVFSFIASRIEGLDFVGEFSLVISYGVGAAIFLKFGFDAISVRVVSVFHKANNKQAIAKYYTLVVVFLLLSTAFTFLVCFIGRFYISFVDSRTFHLLQLGLVVGAALSYSQVVAAILRSTNNPASGQLLDVGFFSFLAAFVLLVIFYFNRGMPVEIQRLTCIAAGLIGVLALVLGWRSFGLPLWFDWSYSFSFFRTELRSLFYFFSIALVQYLNSYFGVVFSGYHFDAAQVGELSIAIRFGMVPFILLNLIGTTVAPKFAADYYSKDLDSVGRREKRVRGILRAISIVIFFMGLLGGRYLLGYFSIFDSGFYCFLVILAAQCLNLMFGASTHAISSMGFERDVLKYALVGAGVGCLFTIVVDTRLALLGPSIGIFLSATIPAYLCMRKFNNLFYSNEKYSNT